MQPLPIDEILPRAVETLRRARSLVVEAPPGAGKTTRLPPALLDAAVADGDVLVLEPRRIAARMSARRVAEERGETVGETIGYQVRFEDVSSGRTRLRFLTEGVLTRRLLADPTLKGVGCVVLDEFHERHLQADLALALLRRLQRTSRPDLKLVAMSATLDAAPVARYLDDCAVLRSEGRRFEVNVEHLTRHDERPLELQVEAAVRRLVSEGLDGHVLVFLPGAAAIRRAQEACAGLAAEAGLLVLPLHGELPAAEQDAAVRPSSQTKLILSTNVAETSVTIEGVAAVVDSGLARVASHSPWSGLPLLKVSRVSRASAVQRAGRAGRTREGRCLRLYTAQDFGARPEHETPEVRRLDLAESVLELRAAGVVDPAAFEWFEAPSAESLEAAETLLRRLGATDAAGRVTEAGRAMLRLPLHPRLARIVVEAERRGVAREACAVAALISERDIRAGRVSLSTGKGEAARERRRTPETHGASDLLELLDLFEEASAAGFAAERLRRLDLEPNAVRAVARVTRQLRRLLGRVAKSEVEDEKNAVRHVSRLPEERERELSDERERELLISVLAGYPDRVARRRAGEARREGSVELLLSGGGTAELAPESVVRESEFLVAVDAEERGDAQRTPTRAAKTVVRLASAIEPDWLLDLFADALEEKTEARWNPQAERVEVVRRLVYDRLVVEEWRAPKAVGAEVTRALAEAALEAGPEVFDERGATQGFLARVEFVARTFPEAAVPALGDEDLRAALAEMCEGRRGFAELREAARAGELLERLRSRLTPEQSRLVAQMAPERVTLARGRQARVEYERGQAPSVASRLQDFFGMREGPRVAAGRVPLVLRLLAPSQRPVQVTTDLAGFWSREYPRVRRELGRRYPRHAWPEDPLQI
ncbi:MAG TPA: ATP-dependent helicase C-terminal domain-containing protein [Pyrinomonadaceae bacterium]|nr:ATP-dependent helicase C-terminal domain-containing protein [Pyrinomonadaceae bacterium]